MTSRDLLVQQYEAIYRVIARNVEGLTHADSLQPTVGGGNTANWVLGHLVNVQNVVMKLVGAPPVWESPQLERARFDHRIRDAAEAIDWDTLVSRFNASHQACITALGSVSVDGRCPRRARGASVLPRWSARHGPSSRGEAGRDPRARADHADRRLNAVSL